MLVREPAAPDLERVKLLDFGIAKLDVRSLNLEDPQTRTGVLMGTPHYMSPEQCRGAAKVDDKADVYSLGVIFFHMLTGRLPFLPTGEGEGEGAILAMHIYETPPAPRSLAPGVSTGMEDLVLNMLRKDRVERLSMGEVAGRLEEMTGSLGLPRDLSMTFEEAPPTTRLPEPMTIIGVSSPSQPSTLGGGTGQLAPGGLPRSLVAGGVLFGAVVISGLGLFAILHRPAPPVEVPVETQPAVERPPPPPPPIRCTLDSVPTGAKVVRATDGISLGRTPYAREQAHGDGPLPLLISLPKFNERAIDLDCRTGPLLRAELSPLAEEKPAKKKPGKGKKGGKKAGKKGGKKAGKTSAKSLKNTKSKKGKTAGKGVSIIE